MEIRNKGNKINEEYNIFSKMGDLLKFVHHLLMMTNRTSL